MPVLRGFCTTDPAPPASRTAKSRATCRFPYKSRGDPLSGSQRANQGHSEREQARVSIPPLDMERDCAASGSPLSKPARSENRVGGFGRVLAGRWGGKSRPHYAAGAYAPRPDRHRGKSEGRGRTWLRPRTSVPGAPGRPSHSLRQSHFVASCHKDWDSPRRCYLANCTGVVTMAPRSSVRLTNQVFAAAGGHGQLITPLSIAPAMLCQLRWERKPVSVV